MSLARLQVIILIYKEPLYFSIVAMTKPKLKFKSIIWNSIKKYETLRDTLTKEMKDLHTKNYKILLRDERPK